MKTNLTLGIVVGLFAAVAACGPSKPAENADDGAGASAGTAGTGGSTATGGESTGGSSATGGTTTGGSDAGGAAGTGGAATGGSDAGGAGTGGSAGTGGAGTGGAGTGGSAGTGGAGAGGAGGGPAQPPAALVAAADATNGAKLYESEKCNNCHGTLQKGPVGKFPNLFKVKWDDKEIEEAFGIIKKGKSPMPPYGDKLNDKQIADIVAYLKKNPAK